MDMDSSMVIAGGGGGGMGDRRGYRGINDDRKNKIKVNICKKSISTYSHNFYLNQVGISFLIYSSLQCTVI